MRAKVKGRFEPLSDYEIEAYLCGELGPEEKERVESAIAESAQLKQYIQKRQKEREAFFRDHPRIELPEAPQPITPFRIMVAVGATAILAAIVVTLVLWAAPDKGVEIEPSIRAMGAVKATLTVQREERIFQYREGVLLREGDRVRLSVESPQSGHLTVLARGPGGSFEIYYDSLRTDAGEYTVPDSLVLDEQVGVEDWYIILADQKQNPQNYIQQLRQQAPLDARATVIRIVKEVKP